MERGEKVKSEIIKESGNSDIHLFHAELSSQKSIRNAVEDFKKKFTSLHVLINNAGILVQNRQITEDGYELQFAVNYLAPFLLTNLLLDILKSSAPSRIMNVSAMVHKGAKLDFNDLQNERNYRSRKVYAQTKLATVLFTYELSRKLQGSNVTANCLHPGIVNTDLLKKFTPPMPSFMRGMIGGSLDQGASTSIYLATSPEVEGFTGKYFSDQKAVGSSKVSYDKPLAKRLWDVSLDLCNLSS